MRASIVGRTCWRRSSRTLRRSPLVVRGPRPYARRKAPQSLAVAENQIDLGQLRKEFEPDRRMEIRGALDGPLRQRSNAQRVEDRLGHPVSMALGPKDHGRAVRTGAAVQLRIPGPCAGEGTPPDVLVHDVVQEQGVQMVPFEPRRGALEAAGRCLS